ncbi:hypothetical protein O0L34_g9271 [Tuta absoluta]|nr:hypothetical protein O0L34_g9271 [Tuta absoluta]
MNRVDQNINKDMSDFDLIDVESLDFSDEQTWLCTVPGDSGTKVDLIDWGLSLDWPVYEDEEYQQTERELYSMLDEILNNQVLAMPDKHKFDSRTYVRPKKAVHRPSIQTLVESNPPCLSNVLNTNKYATYNKYNSPLGPILRLKTFSVDANTENSNAVKEYAMKRKSLVQEDTDPQLEDVDMTLVSETSDRLSSDHLPTKPINIDLSQPASNFHSTFNKGMMLNDRGSLNMYQSGESLMRMSPPSLVSSLLMESSGNFNQESLEGRRSISNRDSGVPPSGRESIDQMMTSMTLSILDEKDMSTSFLSQTTYPDHDSLMDSLPPSLVSSVNSSYVVSNHTPRGRTDSVESNVFSSATFTHLEQSEKLLSARPRHQMYNSFKRDTPMRNSGSYTKSREEGCQIDNGKILNENIDKKDSTKMNKSGSETTEPITLHYANNKFVKRNNAEKENLNNSFEKDDKFYKDMGMQRTIDLGRNSMNVTLDKQELNEIIQARQKLSLARKALPTEPLPNQVEASPNKNVPQTETVPKKSMDNASELLSRRRAFANGYDTVTKSEDIVREPPKRNATFKKASPRADSMDATVVYLKDENNIIDINSATLNLVDASDKTLQHEEWGSQERAMVGSSESTDTATFSSSSPPESVPDTGIASHPRSQVASTPLIRKKDGRQPDLLNLHHTVSPIYGLSPIDDKSYTVTKVPSPDGLNTIINTGTIVKRPAKRDILAGKTSPEKKMAPAQVKSPVKLPTTASYVMAPPTAVPKKTGLPTSKLRQYSSHRELRIPAGPSNSNNNGPSNFGYGVRPPGRTMVRRNVYASNPVLSPTSSITPNMPPLHRTDSYTIAREAQEENEVPKPVLTNPPVLVRQGTETLRRERPQSQMVQPKDTTRPYSIAGASNFRVNRPTSGPQKPTSVPPALEPRPQSTTSALPRPSRLPAPRRTGLRPPSVYSVAPAAEADHY